MIITILFILRVVAIKLLPRIVLQILLSIVLQLIILPYYNMNQESNIEKEKYN